jgi:kanamycin kinase
MILRSVTLELSEYPAELRSFLSGAKLYDSSCSEQAKTVFIDKDGGYFLKSAPKGSLKREEAMTRYFHGKGLSAEALAYVSGERDWLLTRKIPGDDCTSAEYLGQPEQLCETLAECLLTLHGTDFINCPAPNHTERYLANLGINSQASKGNFDFARYVGYTDIDDARRDIAANARLLQNDTLIHGDCCLPNVILDNWRFSGFADLDSGGIGDRHVDIYWAIWTLQYNLHTDKYRGRFLDCYGRERVDWQRVRLCGACEAMIEYSFLD